MLAQGKHFQTLRQALCFEGVNCAGSVVKPPNSAPPLVTLQGNAHTVQIDAVLDMNVTHRQNHNRAKCWTARVYLEHWHC